MSDERQQLEQWVELQPTKRMAADVLGITEDYLYKLLGGRRPITDSIRFKWLRAQASGHDPVATPEPV